MSRVRALAHQLALIACEADQIVLELSKAPLTDAEALALSAPCTHLWLVAEGLDEQLRWADSLHQPYGQPGYPPRPASLPTPLLDRWEALRRPFEEAA